MVAAMVDCVRNIAHLFFPAQPRSYLIRNPGPLCALTSLFGLVCVGLGKGFDNFFSEETVVADAIFSVMYPASLLAMNMPVRRRAYTCLLLGLLSLGYVAYLFASPIRFRPLSAYFWVHGFISVAALLFAYRWPMGMTAEQQAKAERLVRAGVLHESGFSSRCYVDGEQKEVGPDQLDAFLARHDKA